MQVGSEEPLQAVALRAVYDAFGVEHAPPITSTPPIGEVDNMRAELAGVPWHQVTADQLMRHRAALAMLDPAAFAYYLPAFLIGGIENHDLRDAALAALAPRGTSKQLRATAPAVFAMLTSALTPPQRDAIRAWVRWARSQYVSPKRYDAMSLTGPWLGESS